LQSIRPFEKNSGQHYPTTTELHQKSLQCFKYLPQEVPSLKFAIEFRHPSWYSEETAQLLSDRGVCWVITEYPGLPMDLRQTTDFLYIRWIGEHGKYHPHTHERVDKTNQLELWWNQIKPFLNNIHAFYGFFNNDYAGFAAGTCKFMKIVGFDIEENNILNNKAFK
jgi:uncharacterized protein YecE (DUF72 family)